ncbi:unnamed protein product [Menidia menidia]|uniref:(Atlantic silverside) hypothetical protein n=1 Tax=Menidia menidia TaxID=238744 RepID=A0A8S4AG66_9TELE|nr:unnamed protein product [Menidia menidia]
MLKPLCEMTLCLAVYYSIQVASPIRSPSHSSSPPHTPASPLSPSTASPSSIYAHCRKEEVKPRRRLPFVRVTLATASLPGRCLVDKTAPIKPIKVRRPAAGRAGCVLTAAERWPPAACCKGSTVAVPSIPICCSRQPPAEQWAAPAHSSAFVAPILPSALGLCWLVE